jgi:hypothetical protein
VAGALAGRPRAAASSRASTRSTRSRELAARALGYRSGGTPTFGLRRTAPPTGGADAALRARHLARRQALARGRLDSSRPAADRRGWRIALPHAGATEQARAQRCGGARPSADGLAGDRSSAR